VFALLNINKPAGLTSRKVVDRVQKCAGIRKVGHAGTLDPLATGVLVICLGPATRLIEYVQRMPKRYRASFLFGRTSPTEDTDGDVCMLDNPPVPSSEEIRLATQSLVGTIRQRPPAFSAVKVGGQRAYQRARRGENVELAERDVVVHELSVVAYDYPTLVLEVCCSAGTYVRSLGRDLAASLGTGAVMSALTRTAVGDFCVDEAVPLDDLQPDNLDNYLLSPRRAVAHLPSLVLAPQQAQDVLHGRCVSHSGSESATAQSYAAVDTTGRLLAILTRRKDGKLWPLRVFPP
jgi:tRNA pseudouridine55 synthase